MHVVMKCVDMGKKSMYKKTVKVNKALSKSLKIHSLRISREFYKLNEKMVMKAFKALSMLNKLITTNESNNDETETVFTFESRAGKLLY